jgi:uncharacterized membrane protein YkoI
VFSIPVEPLKAEPPAIPFSLPSQLLERRPDIAAAERRVAEANAQIGVTKAAFFPSLTLGATAGFTSSSIASWFSWPARFFSVGPSLAQTIFDKGRRKAATEQARAEYDATVAIYRETVLTAFQEVEDNLAALGILSRELEQQEAAVKSSERALTLANDRYKSGIDSYLNVITAQATLLSNQRTAVNLRTLQMTASVQLIKALGGGWNASQIPMAKELAGKTLPAVTQPSSVPEPKITIEQAKEIALNRIPGNVEGVELKREHGHLVYSFDVRNAEGTLTEVQVDTRNGKIVRVKEKNAKQEAEEKRKEEPMP